MKNSKLIEALNNCTAHCNYCADACLDEENMAMMKECIRTDRVCAEVCSTLSQVLATSYSDIQGLVDFCRKTCEACAEECSKHEHQHCQDCAEACKKCAEACGSYAA